MPGRPQYPNAVLLSPAPFAVMLPKLAFFPRDNDPDWAATFFRVADQLLDVAVADGRLVLVVHDDARLQRDTARIAVGKNEISVARELLANADASPRPCLVGETDLLQFSPSS